MLRFAPSPTGYLHVGNARIAILNYLFAKKNNLEYFLRFDDTDTVRSKKIYEEQIKIDLDWLGIRFKSSFNQFDRLDTYKGIADDLKKKGFIYPCYEKPEELEIKRKLQLKSGKPPLYDRSALKLTSKEINEYVKQGIKPHWRFKLNSNPIKWKDLLHGNISFENLPISDPVVIRSDGTPLFTLTSVIDDLDFKISHVIRGDDHITNTAAQIQLFHTIGDKAPKFAHVPLMKSISGEQLSKRDKSFSLSDIKNNGIQSEVLFNMLSKLGSKHSYDKIDSLLTLQENFEINNFSKNTINFNFSDLEKMNSKFLCNLSINEIKNITHIDISNNQWSVIKPNIKTFEDIGVWFDIINKSFKKIEDNSNSELFKIAVECLPDNISEETWKLWCLEINKKTGISGKKLFLPLRLKLTGRESGPEMKKIINILGKNEIIRRLV